MLFRLHPSLTVLHTQVGFFIPSYLQLTVIKLFILLFESEGLEIGLIDKLYEFPKAILISLACLLYLIPPGINKKLSILHTTKYRGLNY